MGRKRRSLKGFLWDFDWFSWDSYGFGVSCQFPLEHLSTIAVCPVLFKGSTLQEKGTKGSTAAVEVWVVQVWVLAYVPCMIQACKVVYVKLYKWYLFPTMLDKEQEGSKDDLALKKPLVHFY